MAKKQTHRTNARDKLTFTNDVTQNVVNDVYDLVPYKINGLSNQKVLEQVGNYKKNY